MATKKKIRKEETMTIKKFIEIIKDPIVLLLERLRHDSENGGDDFVEDIEERLCDSLYADEYTELKIFEYLSMVNKPENKYHRDDFFDEIIDRVKNPKTENKEITARRYLYDYLNLEGGDLGGLCDAVDLVKTKKDKKIIEKYLKDADEDYDADCDGLGDVLVRLYKKYPL